MMGALIQSDKSDGECFRSLPEFAGFETSCWTA
jgi:hypothetical protein